MQHLAEARHQLDSWFEVSPERVDKHVTVVVEQLVPSRIASPPMSHSSRNSSDADARRKLIPALYDDQWHSEFEP